MLPAGIDRPGEDAKIRSPYLRNACAFDHGGRMDNLPRDAGSGPAYALSLKQPWAALLVSGHKTIEVRRWPTTRRGHVLIHAARISDARAEVWKLVPDELRDAASLV